MARLHNFYAGPAALPLTVLEQIQAELLDYDGAGMSILEISHRSNEFDTVIKSAETGMRKLLGISDDYAVLFLQGGASLQFAMVPMNLLNGANADYIDTGVWSSKAIKEAKNFGSANVIFSDKENNYKNLPELDTLKFTPGAAYTHITSNNTIFGTQFSKFPKTDSPLIADMSSDILSRPLEVNNFGIIYAGAQKNIGPSGVTAVIIRKDLAEKAGAEVPAMLSYKTHIEKDSLFNTPPTLGIRIIDLVCQWLEKNGGLCEMAQKNQEKADLLYAAIDNSNDFYNCPVTPKFRSKMNVVFCLGKEDLTAEFVTDSQAAGMVGLKGHRSVGGIRASIYNATGLRAVKDLCSFMNDFAKHHG